MKGLFYGLGLLALVFSTSCVPHKDTVFYQVKDQTSDSLQLMVDQPKEYRLQVYDIVSIQVKALDQDNVAIFNPVGDENLNASSSERAYYDGFTVDVHGNIRVPTLGYINVLGFTTEEVQKLLEKRLLEEQFKETANIFVTVKLAGLRYNASGEVNNSGSQVIFKERVDIYEAVANAGGPTQFGDLKDVMVIRQYPQGQKIHHLDITDIDVMKSPFYYIQPNDMIYIKPLKQKSWGLGTNAFQTFTAIFGVVSIITTTYLLLTR